MIKYRISIFIITSLIFGSLIVSCLSDSNKINSEKVDNSFYKSEIFKSEFRIIYGSWKLQQIETGWGAIKPDFDYMVIKPIGIFSIFRNDSILTHGKIEIIDQNKKSIKVKLISNNNIKVDLLEDNEKSIDFKNKDLIWLIAPCCDRANYLLKRLLLLLVKTIFIASTTAPTLYLWCRYIRLCMHLLRRMVIIFTLPNR